MPSQHTPLFHPRAVRRALETHIFPANLESLHAQILPWVKRLKSGALDKSKEVSLHGEFLVRVFGDILGYRGFAQGGEEGWELSAEKTVSKSGKSVDGAIGFFGAGGESTVIAPIELKGSTQSLDLPDRPNQTPVQQAWEYADHSPYCRWVIVSNYRETRLYNRLHTPAKYELFDLEKLADLKEFKRFYLFLSRGQLLRRTPGDSNEQAPLDDLLVSSEQVQAEITKELYREYRDLRNKLYTHLGQVHSNMPALDLLRHTQTILDRFLFVAFAEDRGLLSKDTLSKALAFQDPYNPRPIWQNFVSVFRWINKGNESQRVPAYNGGLFKENTELDELEISDQMCKELTALSRFDYFDDVSVEVLGHIFEQSISDLEELRAEASGKALPKVSKRKAEGVFYTPSYITAYIVEQTLGAVLKEKWEAAFAIDNPKDEKKKALWERKEIAAWERYRDALKQTRVLDPACGSGAFLIAAFDVLAREYERVNAVLASFQGGQAGLFDLTATILNNNLFGVDLNEESVEITKLSLWLKTCSRDRRLTYLDRNIKCGNSVVSDAMIDPRAFDWRSGTLARSFINPPENPEDEEIDARWRDGFDVVIGNPPYVRQELLVPYKAHFEQNYRSYSGVADLFVYFFERGLSLLKPKGRLGVIASNSWLRANYGTQLRAHLRKHATVEAIVDLGDNRVFDDAPDVYPAIVIAGPGEAPEGRRTKCAAFARGEGIREFAKQLENKWTLVSIHDQPDTGWHLGGDLSRQLLKKLLTGGHALSGHAKGAIYRGVLTGLNEAFLIDSPVKDKLIHADPGCAALIKKMLRGEDLRPWYQEDEGRWLIAMPSGWTRTKLGAGKDEAEAWKVLRKSHPSIAEFLFPFAQAARGRHDQGEFWWELRSCSYYDQFGCSKVFWPNITKFPRFSWDTDGKFINDKGYILPTDDFSLLALLQSRATWFVISQICTPLGERKGALRYQLFSQFIERLPIPSMSPEQRADLSRLAQEVTKAAQARYALHQKTRRRMADLLPKDKSPNRKLLEWWNLEFAALRAELQKTFKQDIPLRDRDDWQELWKERRSEHKRLSALIIAGETEINERVYGLFELSKEEIRLIEEESKYAYGEV